MASQLPISPANILVVDDEPDLRTLYELTLLREGYRVAFLPVNHRHRETGRSKYTNLGRLIASASDLFGVMWLQSRARNPGGVDET